MQAGRTGYSLQPLRLLAISAFLFLLSCDDPTGTQAGSSTEVGNVGTTIPAEDTIAGQALVHVYELSPEIGEDFSAGNSGRVHQQKASDSGYFKLPTELNGKYILVVRDASLRYGILLDSVQLPLNKDLSLKLQPLGALEGTLDIGDSNPTSIGIYLAGLPSIVNPNQDGSFAIDNLPPGNYRLLVALRQCPEEPLVHPISIRPGETTAAQALSIPNCS